MSLENLIKLLELIKDQNVWIGLGILCIFINLLKK